MHEKLRTMKHSLSQWLQNVTLNRLMSSSCCILPFVLLFGVTVHADDSKLFLEKVAPMLETHCLRCHYPGNEEGDVSLATPDDLRNGGYLDIRNGDQSHLLDLVEPVSAGKKPEMPEDGDPLSSEQVGVLRKWVVQGALWPKGKVLKEASQADASWWAFQALKEVSVPDVTKAPVSWKRNPVDAFIFEELQNQHLSPSLPASRRQLIRRLCFDLTGLPPSVEQVERFVGDPSPDAYEHLVDRLLASPHYGERWGRHWLDVIRFGESRGFERNEIIRNAWPFRDYVIRSFNQDKPLNRLIKEHLAGDQLGPNQPDVEIGTTFLVCGPYDDVGNQDPAQAAQIRANTIDEMIRASSEAFLGLTVGCARCHHHKFDPISQEDYYRLYATFAGVRHGSREIASNAEREQRKRMMEPLDAERNGLAKERERLELVILKRAEMKKDLFAESWTRDPIKRTGVEERFEKRLAKYVRLIVEGTESNPYASSGYGIDEFEVWTSGKTGQNVASLALGGFAKGASRIAEDFVKAYSAQLTIDGEYGARWIARGSELSITLSKPTEIDRIYFSSDRGGDAGNQQVAHFVSEYRLEVSLDGEQWEKVADSHDRQPVNEAHRKWRWMKMEQTSEERQQLKGLDRAIARVDRERKDVPELPRWWAGNFTGIEESTYVFIGGNPQRKGKEVVPASLSAFDTASEGYRLDPGAAEGKRRLALANWLVSGENPLTPRVWVNRIWQKHFGHGLVSTPSDFGVMGSQPSHADLLDWLAGQLLDNGWRMKPLHKLLLMSQAYRQSSTFRSDAARADADSKFLWRFPPRRLSAEEIRDSMLKVSGMLKEEMGGAGFKLYRYLQDNVATYQPLDHHGSETYRRGIYHHNARAAIVDLMTEFDCPDPAFPAPKRASTTTPLQALTLLNHSFTLDMAKALSNQLDQDSAGDDERWVTLAYLRSYGRNPVESELKKALAYKADLGGVLFCRALFNSNEFIHID